MISFFSSSNLGLLHYYSGECVLFSILVLIFVKDSEGIVNYYMIFENI